MEVDEESVSFSNSSPFVAPGQLSNLSADVVWTKGGQPVQTMIEISALINGVQQYGFSENESQIYNLLHQMKQELFYLS